MSGLCGQPVCDTTETQPDNPDTPLEEGCCLPHNAVWTNATIRTDDKGCIYSIESGEPPLYTPDPCCPTPPAGGGGGAGLDGPPGQPGQSATITIGTVSALAPGSLPVVTNSGTSTAAILDFKIPVGEPGVDGGSPTGETTTDYGYDIQSGLIQELPTLWPPILKFNPSLSSNNGITLQFAKVGDTVNVTLDASVMAGNNAAAIATLNATIAALTTSLASAQDDIATLSTALSTAVARIDAAGIP